MFDLLDKLDATDDEQSLTMAEVVHEARAMMTSSGSTSLVEVEPPSTKHTRSVNDPATVNDQQRSNAETKLAETLAAMIDRPSWHQLASCRNEPVEVFFPEHERGQPLRRAQKICAQCPVRKACRSWSLGRGDLVGVWGGLSIRDRWRMRQGAA